MKTRKRAPRTAMLEPAVGAILGDRLSLCNLEGWFKLGSQLCGLERVHLLQRNPVGGKHEWTLERQRIGVAMGSSMAD